MNPLSYKCPKCKKHMFTDYCYVCGENIRNMPHKDIFNDIFGFDPFNNQDGETNDKQSRDE